MRTPSAALEPVDTESAIKLAAKLGSSPETVISVHLLRRGLALAYVVGAPTEFAAAVVRNLACSSDELTAFGDDPASLWELLRGLDDWRCVSVTPAVAPAIAARLAAATGSTPRLLSDLYHVAEQPVPRFPNPTVRLVTPADADLMLCAAPAVRGAGWQSARELLDEGLAAAAVVDGEIRTLAHTSARAGGDADVGVATLPEWRGQGLATASAALVVERIQAAGEVPVWSTGESNAASLSVARKLRFREVARRVYVIRGDAAVRSGA